MQIVKHREYPNVRNRLVSREMAYTTVEHDSKTYIRTQLDPKYGGGFEWEMSINNKIYLISEELENDLEQLYQEELKRIQRENKLNRIV